MFKRVNVPKLSHHFKWLSEFSSLYEHNALSHCFDIFLMGATLQHTLFNGLKSLNKVSKHLKHKK